MQNLSEIGLKDYLTKASLGWKCFGTYKRDRKLYNFNDKNVRGFIRKSIKGGRKAAFNRYFEANQCEVKLITHKNLFKTNDNELSKTVDEYLEYKNNKRDEIKTGL